MLNAQGEENEDTSVEVLEQQEAMFGTICQRAVDSARELDAPTIMGIYDATTGRVHLSSNNLKTMTLEQRQMLAHAIYEHICQGG